MRISDVRGIRTLFNYLVGSAILYFAPDMAIYFFWGGNAYLMPFEIWVPAVAKT